jgi:DNA repair protein RecO (recombination protein O)
VTDRSRSYSTEGIVLRRRNIGEADSILTLFSLHEGKFDAVARGVRKAKSRMRGHLEPLTRVQVHVARGRSLDVFTQAETIEAHRALKADLERMNLALYCAELADRFTIDRVEQRPIYELLVDVFHALDGGASAQAARYFELHLLAITGYEAQLDACAICRQKLPEEETLISGPAGGLVCRVCRPAASSGRILSVRAIKVLRYGRTATIDQFDSLRLDDALEHELRAALGDLVRPVLDRELNTTRYIDALERADRIPALSANHVQSDQSNPVPPEP